MSATENAGPTREPGRWMALYSLNVAILAVVFDGALFGLISPSVAQDLGVDAATIGLIASMSTLMLAAFILGGGVLGDIHGRKRLLTYGLIGLCLTSVLAVLSPSESMLIPVRALAGVMAALVNPLTLAILTVTFDNEERPKALGLFFAVVGVAGGLGTIVISFLNQQFGWRATFVLVIVLAAAALVMVSRFVQESKASGSTTVDWIGIVLAAVGLFGLIYGINQAAVNGFLSPAVLVPVAVGLAVLVILVFHSGRIENPALRLVLFNNRVFAIGVLIFVLMGFAQMGAFFQLSTYLQALQGVSPIQAAITLLPMTMSLFVFAILAGRWVGKYSMLLLIGGGLVLMALGLALIAVRLSPSAGFAVYLVPMVLLGGGYSIANTPRVSAVLATAPRELAGAASATNNAAVQIGIALGIAVMGALFQGFARTTYYGDLRKAGLNETQVQDSVDVLSAWLKTNSGNVADQFGITVQHLEGVITNYQGAYTTGVQQVLFIGAVAAAVAAVLAWFTFRKQ